jgi:N-sulfoglucosamine sulfohydrolase
LEKINRRRFLGYSALGTASLGTGLSVSGCSKDFSRSTEHPNIILITADDMGWKDLSCYGNRNIETKNIDRLATEGVKFTNAFVVSSSCSPSRAAILTGQYPHTNQVTALTHRHKTRALNPFYKTLPAQLSKAGYNTGLMGKWHISPYLPTSWYGYHERMTGLGLSKGDWVVDKAEKAINYIDRNRDNRFYLEINFLQNHRIDHGQFYEAPNHPVDWQKVQVPDYWALPDWDDIRKDAARYYSQTLQMDAIIGEILDHLDSSGLSENTMVVFLSDNGAPYPGNKLTLYDRGIGTPLLIRWPTKIGAHTQVESLVNSIDIMPSILEACGLEIPEQVQGQSFWEHATGKRKDALHEAIFTEMTDHVFYIPTRSVRTREWKYIRNYSDIGFGLDELDLTPWAHKLCDLPNHPWKKPRIQEELYFLPDDPNEQVNLADQTEHLKILEYTRKLLDDHMQQTDDPFLGKPFTHDYSSREYEMPKE